MVEGLLQLGPTFTVVALLGLDGKRYVTDLIVSWIELGVCVVLSLISLNLKASCGGIVHPPPLTAETQRPVEWSTVSFKSSMLHKHLQTDTLRPTNIRAMHGIQEHSDTQLATCGFPAGQVP